MEAVTATLPEALLLVRKQTQGPWIPHLPTALSVKWWTGFMIDALLALYFHQQISQSAAL